MKAVSERSWIPRAILLIIALFFAPTGLSAQPTASCTCDDVPGLIDLLGIYSAGLNKTQQYLSSVNPTDMYNEILQPPDPARTTRGESAQKALQEAMEQANRRGQAGESCLKAINEARNSYVDEAFRAYRAEQKLGKDVDLFNVLPLQRYLQIYRDAYTRTISEILRRLQDIERRCHPGDWFGTITVSENRKMDSTDTIPGTDRFNQGTQGNVSDITTRTGMIWFSGNASNTVAKWRLTGKFIYTLVHNGKQDCDSSHKENLKGVKTEALLGEVSKTGSPPPIGMSIDPELSEDGRRLKVYFQIPAVEFATKIVANDNVTGGCYETPPGVPETGTGTDEFAAVQVESHANVFPGNPLKVSGSDTVDLVPRAFSASQSMKITHTVTLTYNLYKFR